MASENKNENVMLTGQTAYFKKNGSMTNYGKLTIDNQEVSVAYGPGFVDEGSTLQPAVLETSADYENTLEDMQLYLGDDFIEETEDYLVKTNAENIATELQPREATIRTYIDNMYKYTDLSFVKTKNSTDNIGVLVPVKLSGSNFVLQIKSDLSIQPEESVLIDSEVFKLWQDESGKFYINDIEIPDLSHKESLMEIIQCENKLFIKLNDKIIFTHDITFNYEIEANVNTQFMSILYFIKIYGNEGITQDIKCKYEVNNAQCGLYDVNNSMWYPIETEIRLYYEYESANIWSGALDLGYCPGPNTGLEVTYYQYSSQSTSTNTYRNIVGCYSQYSVANTMSFGILVGSGSTVYATRQNNQASWVNSGVVSASGSVSTVTLNKHNDRRFKSTGNMVFDKAISTTATIQNSGGATLWLAGSNDLGRYIPLSRIETKDQIPDKSDIYIYNVKIYEDTQLVRDYVVAKDLNGRTGMWDKINNKLYPASNCSFSIRGGILN